VGVAYLGGSGARLVCGFTGDRREIDTALDAVGAILDRRPFEARALLAALDPVGAAAPGGAGAPGTVASALAERFGAAAAATMLGSSGPRHAFSTGADPGIAFVAEGSSDRSVDPTLGQVVFQEPEQLGASFADAAETSPIRTMTREIGRLATLLRDVPGQRQLLYLSEGFSSRILNNFISGDRAYVLRLLERMFESLRQGGWTLHAIDVEGIPGPFSGPGFDAHALFYMANETGGQLYENFNRVQEATALLVARTSLTYVLTIRPGELPRDGRLHRLDVRLREPAGRGTRVLHRTGYYAPKPFARKDPIERQMDTVSLLLGDTEVEDLGARLHAGTLPLAGGVVSVPVVVEVPGRGLLAGRSRAPIDLEVQVFAIDAHEAVQDVWVRTFEVDRDAVRGSVERGGIRMLGGLALPPGEYRLRTLVRASSSERVFLATTPLTVAPGNAGLLPIDPVVIDRSGEWLELVALPSGPGGASADALSRGAVYVLPPVAPRIQGGDGVEFLVVTRAGEPVVLSARLLDREGREVAPPAGISFGAAVPSPRGAFVHHLGRAATAGLPPGRYRLEVRASDASTHGVAARTVPLEIGADG
jgi:hypothetical protein